MCNSIGPWQTPPNCPTQPAFLQVTQWNMQIVVIKVTASQSILTLVLSIRNNKKPA